MGCAYNRGGHMRCANGRGGCCLIIAGLQVDLLHLARMSVSGIPMKLFLIGYFSECQAHVTLFSSASSRYFLVE